MVEYHPYLWRRDEHKLVHIHSTAAEVDEHYVVDGGVVGHIGASLDALRERCRRHRFRVANTPRRNLLDEIAEYAEDQGYPVKPQKIINDIRRALGPDDIVISDVGAHKMWLARLYQAERPNTCIVSNGFAAMGIALPGAIAASLVHPGQDRPGGHRRRRLHDELPGARDGRPLGRQHGGAHLERLVLRTDRVEAGLPTGALQLC